MCIIGKEEEEEGKFQSVLFSYAKVKQVQTVGQ